MTVSLSVFVSVPLFLPLSSSASLCISPGVLFRFCCTFCVISSFVTLEIQQASLIYDVLAQMSAFAPSDTERYCSSPVDTLRLSSVARVSLRGGRARQVRGA